MDKHNSNFNNSDKSDLDSTKKFNIDEILNHKSDTVFPSDIPEFSQSKFSDNSFENSSKEYPDDSNEIFEEMHGNSEVSPLVGFCPDTSTLDTKFSQINAVKSNSGIWEGALPNYEEVYQNYIKDLGYAGVEEITTELQKQVDEFLATK